MVRIPEESGVCYPVPGSLKFLELSVRYGESGVRRDGLVLQRWTNGERRRGYTI
jgi:hypothetical protein